MTFDEGPAFRVMARSVVLMGAELVTDSVVAVIELVKNAWDAEASSVEVVLSTANGTCTIRDDGHGMALTQIKQNWLAIGTANKAPTIGTAKKRTGRLSRVVQGEKGIGRLSAQRLGRYLRLTTRKRNGEDLEPTESVLEVDWADFLDPGKEIHQVPLRVMERQPQVFVDASGTLIEMSDPEEAIANKDLERLKFSLMKLFEPFSPFDEQLKLKLVFNGMVQNLDDALHTLLNRAQFTLEGHVDDDWHFEGKLRAAGSTTPLSVDLRPRSSYQVVTNRSTAPQYSFKKCGSFDFKVYAFERRGRGEGQQLLNEYLDSVGRGVMVYRDGVRLLPYGELGDDWLSYDKAASTAAKDWFSNRQLLGFINITRDDNPELKDKTNREGLVENESFKTFRGVLWAAMEYLHLARRRKKAEEDRAILHPVRQVQESINVVLRSPGLAAEAKQKAEEVVATVRTFVKQVEQRESTMSLLSGLGLAAERTTHELAKLIGKLRNVLETMHDHPGMTADARTALKDGLGYLAQIEVELVNLEPLYFRARSVTEVFDTATVARAVQSYFQRDLDESGVKLEAVTEQPLQLREARGLIMQTLFNLVDNALYWAAESKGRHGRVQIRIQGEQGTIMVLDNGPGVSPADQALIFEPLWSTKPGGRGLGLYIIRSLLEERGHSIRLMTGRHDTELTGACFIVEFSRQAIVGGQA